MKKLLCALIFLTAMAAPMAAQTAVPSAFTGTPYPLITALSSPVVTTPEVPTGQTYLLQPSNSYYTWTVTVSGTVSTVQVDLLGSIDGLHWFVIDQVFQTDQQWVAGVGEMSHVVNKGINYVGASVPVLTGSGTVTVTFELVK
jgi:hypothetical protein